MSTIKFNNADALFSKALRNRVNQYFITTSQSRLGNSKLFTKAFLFVASGLTIYITLLSVTLPIWISVLLCVLLGCILAGIGFNIMHDAGHDTFSPNKKLNSILSYSLNALGGNIYFWKLKHNVAHHTYTNIEGQDHDIDVKFMRLHGDQPYRRYHKFQTVYFIFLYSISYMAWVFYQDYEKYFNGALQKGKAKFRFPIKEKVIFWLTKVFHLLVYIILPIYLVGVVPAMIGLVIVYVSCGLCLAIVFQLAHVVSETNFTNLEGGTSDIDNEWMIHQLETTANFSTKSKLMSWLLGGLNFQVEHHLFPKISHVHYPAINKLVKETCKEYGVRYIEFKTMGHAVASHVKHIYRMSLYPSRG